MAWLYQPLLPAAADLQSAAPIATAYWVGGAGTWNATDPTNWAATSGGAGGAGYPDSNSTVYFDGNSGTGTVTINGGVCNDFNISSGASALTLAPTTSGLIVYGSLTVSSTNATVSGSAAITFAATTSETITTGGETFDCPVTFNGVGGTWQLADNFTIGATRTTTLTNGTLNLNGNTLSAGISFATGSGTKNLTFNGGTILCPGTTSTAFNNANPTNFTTTAGTGVGKISMSGATAKTFVGAGSTYNCTLENAGAGALTISGSNTFNDIDNSVQPTTFTFTAGTTTTVTNFSVSGTVGNVVTINSTGAAFTLSKSSGTVSVSYCTISNSTATGGASWQAYTTNGNTDGTGNTGWIFIAPSVFITIDNNVVLGAGILVSF